MGLTMDSVPSFLSFLVLFPLFLPYSADYNKTNEDACPPCFLCESLPESSATSIECVFRPVCCGDSREPPNTNHSQTEKWGHVEKCSSDHNKDNATSPPPLLGHPVSFKSCRLSNDRENPDFYDRYPKTPTCPRSPSQLVLFTCHNNSNQVNPFRDYSANTVYECHPCDDIRNHLHSPFNGSIIELYYDNGDAFSVWGEERSLQFNWSSEIFDCCPGGVDGCHVPPPIPNPKLDHSIVKGDGSGHWRWILGIGIAAIGIVIITLLICYCMRKKFLNYWKSEKGDDQSMKAFVKNFGSEIAPRRYSYSEVKKMTTNFKNKLGQGGFGCVYRGKLNNGQCVAVKVLKESKGNGEEFINEVASISQTSHVNIVGLLGFCFEGHKRALVYEFLPNGSLEKFICNKNFSTECKLGGETLYKIAIGIARGLEYLHVGCKTRILHFDIKPHNILLDKDFCPKISDFGLSKLCLNRESNITTLGARGTIGYIAPEIFSRNFGRISYKSDVYSYGIMILKMTSGRSNSNVDISHTSETYFPHWIYKRLKLDEEIGTHGVTNEFENERVRKMIIIGLWCIQIDPSDRPSMTKVIEMLEGSLENLPIPPRPYLSSPAREPIDSSTI